MKTSDWINKNFGVEGINKDFGHVMRDHSGNIYSYSWHYPLLFKVDGVTFRNVAGYSSTTGKHIGWAGGHGAIDVKLPHNYRLDDTTNLFTMAEFLALEKADKVHEMSQKKRKDTKVYDWLKEQLYRVESNINKLELHRMTM